MTKRIKVIYTYYSAEFYKPNGKKNWSRKSFYTCGNTEIGSEFASALKLMGVKVFEFKEYLEEEYDKTYPQV